MFSWLVDTIFPRRCVGCDAFLLRDEVDAHCCEVCEHTVHEVASPMCPVCALPREQVGGVDAACSTCLADPPAFERVHARWVYDGAVSDAIRRAKAADDPASLCALAERARPWVARLAQDYAGWTWTTPPSHRAALARRGWDPARWALHAARQRSAIDVAHPLAKTRDTLKQARLDRDARHDALIGAFEASDRISGDWVVFDDVMTTGATMHAMASALRSAGAQRVVGIALARSV
jgi:predicted amidophosphoribosyltransferase